jgi:hypothetical protein
MAHGTSLRVIGQSLEAARLSAFELETDGASYLVQSDVLSETGEWILRNGLSPNDISEKDARQSGDRQITSKTFTAGKLEQLGSHLRFRRAHPTQSNPNPPNFQEQSRPRNR